MVMKTLKTTYVINDVNGSKSCSLIGQFSFIDVTNEILMRCKDQPLASDHISHLYYCSEEQCAKVRGSRGGSISRSDCLTAYVITINLTRYRSVCLPSAPQFVAEVNEAIKEEKIPPKSKTPELVPRCTDHTTTHNNSQNNVGECSSLRESSGV